MSTPKIERIPHPLIEQMAVRHYEFAQAIQKAVSRLSEDDAQALKLSAASITDYNCWFVELDVKPYIEAAIQRRELEKRFAAAEESRMKPKRGLASKGGK